MTSRAAVSFCHVDFWPSTEKMSPLHTRHLTFVLLPPAPGKQKKKKARTQPKKTVASASGIPAPAPHAPVSYSRFDKIDTDSDEEEPAQFCRGHQDFPPMDSMEYVRGGDGAASGTLESIPGSIQNMEWTLGLSR